MDEEIEMWLREAVYYPLPLFLSANGNKVLNPNFSSKPIRFRWHYKKGRRHQ